MPTPPVVFAYPIKRPGFITGCNWVGGPTDPEISLRVEYVDASGQAAVMELYTTPAGPATLCLPTSKAIEDLPEGVLVAHLRMAGMISSQVPGSKEYEDAIKGDGVLNTRDFQMPIGNVKVTNIASTSERLLTVTFQKGTATPRDVVVDIADLATYSFAPSTQLLVIAGSIKKQYPTYVHDAATNKFLTQTQMNTIAAYVLGLEPWI